MTWGKGIKLECTSVSKLQKSKMPLTAIIDVFFLALSLSQFLSWSPAWVALVGWDFLIISRSSALRVAIGWPLWVRSTPLLYIASLRRRWERLGDLSHAVTSAAMPRNGGGAGGASWCQWAYGQTRFDLGGGRFRCSLFHFRPN